jgi:hypothetical protein
MRNPIISATLGLGFFYSTVTLVWYLSQNNWSLPYGWVDQTIWRVRLLAACLMVGVGGTLIYLWAKRQWQLAELIGDEERGVTCTIGPLPKPPPPARAEKPVDLATLRLPDNVEHWFEDWKTSMLALDLDGVKVGAPHVRLAEALIQILAAPPTVPAFAPPKFQPLKHSPESPDLLAFARRRAKNPDEPLPPSLRPSEAPPVNRHGDYTLLEHSYAVAFEALKLAPSWSFEASRNQLGRSTPGWGRILVSKVRAAYEWDPEDALVPLVALAHDLGKLQTFLREEDGTFADSGQYHDHWSQVLLARIPEFWELPKLDRDSMLDAVATYHRPTEFTREDPPGGHEDRAFCLQHLLIRADRRAGRQVAEEAYEAEGSADGQDTASSSANGRKVGADGDDLDGILWRCFSEVLAEPGRITQSNTSGSIGFKHVLNGEPVLFLHGWGLLSFLLKRVPLETQSRLGATLQERRPLLKALLSTLAAEGILIREVTSSHGAFSVPAEEAVWRLVLRGRDPTRLAPLAEWKMALIVKAGKHFPTLAFGPDASYTPDVLGPCDPAKLDENQEPRKVPDAARRPLLQGSGGLLVGGGDEDDEAVDSSKALASSRNEGSRAVDPRVELIRKARKAAITGVPVQGPSAPLGTTTPEVRKVSPSKAAGTDTTDQTSAAATYFMRVFQAAKDGSLISERVSTNSVSVKVSDLLGHENPALRDGLQKPEILIAARDGLLPGVSVSEKSFLVDGDALAQKVR